MSTAVSPVSHGGRAISIVSSHRLTEAQPQVSANIASNQGSGCSTSGWPVGGAVQRKKLSVLGSVGTNPPGGGMAALCDITEGRHDVMITGELDWLEVAPPTAKAFRGGHMGRRGREHFLMMSWHRFPPPFDQ